MTATPPPKSFPAEQTAAMRDEIDLMVNQWIDRGWSMEAATGTLLGYALHRAKAGAWQTLDQIVHSIRSAWPLMKIPTPPTPSESSDGGSKL